MKGVDALIATVLILAISIAAIALALQLGKPGLDRNQEILIFQEAKANLIAFDAAIKEVVSQGNGSTRVVDTSVTGGEYSIDSTAENIVFAMQSKAQIVGEGISNIESGVNVTGYLEEVRLRADYAYNILESSKFGAGKRRIVIRNEGFDASAGKQLLSIRVT
ncbi:MAG TPA: hypothetical protein VJH90_02030 [archaeon]|nr:hypothetical protein [archaeon]